jgi:hypothetical protein
MPTADRRLAACDKKRKRETQKQNILGIHCKILCSVQRIPLHRRHYPKIIKLATDLVVYYFKNFIKIT